MKTVQTSFSQVKLVLMLELSDFTDCSIRSQVFRPICRTLCDMLFT